MTNFLAELQRRNVHRAALFYAGAAWLLVQIATQVFPLFHIDESVMRWVVIAVVVGFPFAMLFSWFYEWTPQGIKLESEIDRSESVTRQTGKKLDRWIIAVLSLAVVALLANTFVVRGPAKPAAGVATVAVEKSVAVLPFANLSEDKANAYFAEGIQDEILTRLAKIGALKVISRTSTAHYASAPDDLPAIARQLGVANILEGSVQKIGDQVRVTVQLIRADTDSHLWAETYDRKLTDVFGVESEVATAIAEALQATLSGSEKQELSRKPTDNAAAYDAYLRGLANETRYWFEDAALPEAARFYTQATQLDPRFAQAWARLSRVDAMMFFRQQDTSPARRATAKQALDKAIELQPDATEVLLAQAFYRYLVDRDYPAARQMFERLRPRLPSSSEVPNALASIARRQGFWDESLKYSEQAIDLDPRDPQLLVDRSFTLGITRRFAEAIKLLDRRLEILPGDLETILAKVRLYQAQGQLEQARQLLDGLPPADQLRGDYQSVLERDYKKSLDQVEARLSALPGPEPSAVATAAVDRFNLGFSQTLVGDLSSAKLTFLEARKEFEALLKNEPDNPVYVAQLALIHAYLGDKALALKEGERAMTLLPASRDAVWGPGMEELMAMIEAQAGEPGRAIARLQHLLSINYAGGYGGPITLPLLKLDPIWNPLRGDSRFQKLIADGEAAAKP